MDDLVLYVINNLSIISDKFSRDSFDNKSIRLVSLLSMLSIIDFKSSSQEYLEFLMKLHDALSCRNLNDDLSIVSLEFVRVSKLVQNV